VTRLSLHLYDSLRRTVRPFSTVEPGEARIYVCGMTVDGAPHLGHARSAVVFDVLVRHLEAAGMHTTYVRNVTDVDDRILRRAREQGRAPDAVARENAEAYRRVTEALGTRAPDHEPRVTEHVPTIVALIETLVAQGYAYDVEGDVYFSVEAKGDYGKLSGRRVEEQEPGARVEIDARKRAPEDFALWKAAKPGEPSWPSPWGAGRPGWHVECSAMARALLGDRLDGHGGGTDLRFPHHENEIAQSEAATGQPFAEFWVHNGMVTVRAEKMAKSQGNAVSAESVLHRHGREALRAWFLLAHYRSPIEASERSIADAAVAVERLHATFADAATADPSAQEAIRTIAGRAADAVRAALDDDLDTPGALAALFRAGTEIRAVVDETARGAGPRGPAPHATSDPLRALHEAARPLGVLREDAAGYLAERRRARIAVADVDEADVARRLRERAAARAAGDFARADAIKADLLRQGIVLRDGPHGTTWDVPS
jgi:cysteinyl-tRNA synthetase